VLSADGRIVGQLLANSASSGAATALPILHVIDGPRPSAVVLGLDVGGPRAPAPNVLRVGREDNTVDWVLWKADLPSGAGRVVERGSPATTGWDVDLRGEGRVRFDDDEANERYRILVRAKGESAWRVFASARDREGLPAYLGYSDPEDAIYLARETGEGAQVLSRRLSDGKLRLAGAVPAPAPALLMDPYSKSPVAIAYETDRPGYRWLDPRLEALSAKLERAFPGQDVRFVDWSRDRSRLLVRTDAPDAAPRWYLVDAAKGQASPVGAAYPELAGAALGATRWISYRARDGLEIHAYLTLPPGAGSGPLPLVVLPHGGPAARDDYGFDWWTQFLATRGYAVLRPQFRGSAGFGKAFERAGRREWAGRMQTDLLDGVADLAARGVVDPERVCIVGASFGGYAALAAATLHPKSYRCAVSVNGVSDLELFLSENIRTYGAESEVIGYWRRQLGDARASAGLLAAASPARQAAHAIAPILLIASSEDTTVPYEQSLAMRQALQQAGRPVELVTLEGDDHALSSSAARTRMLEAVEAFLSRNLPV
jgi:dienelactone hydrolase